MKKLLAMLGLMIAAAGSSNAALDVTIPQGGGVIYGYTDVIYGYPSWGSTGEIYSVSGPLLFGLVTGAGGGFASVELDVDTDYPSGYYICGTLPGGIDDFAIDLF